MRLTLYLQINVTLRANQKSGLGSTKAGKFTVDDANSVDMRKAARRIQAQQRFNQIGTEQAENVAKAKTWTQGDTEFSGT